MKIRSIFGVLLTGAVISGCVSTGAGNIPAESGMNDIFEVVKEGGPRQGSAELGISCSLKTHRPGIYSADDPHGTAAHTLLVKIDGQPLELHGTLSEEKATCSEPSNPEDGDGVRYRYAARLRLKPGTHRLVAALAEDGVTLERDITLTEGGNLLVLEPIYRSRTEIARPWSAAPTFKSGIKGLAAKLVKGPL